MQISGTNSKMGVDKDIKWEYEGVVLASVEARVLRDHRRSKNLFRRMSGG